LLVVVSATALFTQPRISHNEGLGFDGLYYAAITLQIAGGDPPQTIAPYVMRPGVPWLAAHFLPTDRSTGDGTSDDDQAVEISRLVRDYLVMDVVANVATGMALLVLLGRYVGTRSGRFLANVLFATAWIGPIRLSCVVPVHVDFVSMAGVSWGLVLVDWMGRTQRMRWVWLLAGMSFVFASVHEVFYAVPLAFLLVANPWRGADSSKDDSPRWNVATLLPLVAAGTMYVLVRQYVQPVDQRGNSFYWQHAREMLLGKPWHFPPVAWLSVFGPALLLVGYDYRGVAGFLKRRQYFGAYLGLAIAVAVLGGTDTERLIFFSFPVVYILIGRAWDRYGHLILASPALLCLFAIGQSLSQRLFFRTPDYPTDAPIRLPILTPWGWEFPYVELFTAFAPTVVPLLTTLEYLVLCVALWWLLARADRASAAPPAVA